MTKKENVIKLKEGLSRLNPDLEIQDVIIFGDLALAVNMWPDELKYPEGYKYTDKYQCTCPDGTIVVISKK